jgi:hypothetical protein
MIPVFANSWQHQQGEMVLLTIMSDTLISFFKKPLKLLWNLTPFSFPVSSH